MSQNNFDKKYSKISPALKFYFLNNLYYKNMTIKDAAARCKLNYSTAKVIIRDLSHKERRYIRRIINAKEIEAKQNKQSLKQCYYKEIIEPQDTAKDLAQSDYTFQSKQPSIVEIVSRIDYDFFAKEEKSL